MTTVHNVTLAQIRALRTLAQIAGDREMADLAGSVINHWPVDVDYGPLRACVDALRSAEYEDSGE